jgi:2-oxoisovalerate dehydrogenase E1 component
MNISRETYVEAFRKMYRVRKLSEVIDQHPEAQQFVHSFPTGHEAIQTAAGMLLEPSDHLFPYYRDTSLIHAAGFDLRDQLMQLFSVQGEPFSGGASYFNHVSYNGNDLPKIILPSAATGMQAIPAVGLAQGIQYLVRQGLRDQKHELVLCSMGEGALSSGEVSEAIQMAVFLQLPVVFLVQDNEWIISASTAETVSRVTPDFYKQVQGLEYVPVQGWKFDACYSVLQEVFQKCRAHPGPVLVHAAVKLLGHHTSKVKKQTYRETTELNDQYASFDPVTLAEDVLINSYKDVSPDEIRMEVDQEVYAMVREVTRMDRAFGRLPDLYQGGSAQMEESGQRHPFEAREAFMAEAAGSAIGEILEDHPEAIYLGQDIGAKLGGVFRESYGLAEKFGSQRVINMSIQEAYMVGCCSGLSAAGCKPIVFIQFADYFMLGINQLFTEISRSYFLTGGKWPVQCLIRIPVGHYKGAGPYHAATIESLLLNIPGVKLIYPSNAADMKGLLKTAFLDPNPVISLEHKGLYWSGNPFSETAKRALPDRDYMIPLGRACIVQHADPEQVEAGRSAVVISYGMGVHWALEAARELSSQVEILDLRTLEPLDMKQVLERVRVHNKCMVVTEESPAASFAGSLAARIQEELFEFLDAPVAVIGSAAVPGIPINPSMEKLILPDPEKIRAKLSALLAR